MHSKIFQIARNEDLLISPLSEDDILDNGFLDRVGADYVSNITNREDDIAQLTEIPGITVTLDTLTVTSKADYMRGNFTLFKEKLNYLNSIGVKEFTEGSSSLAYSMYMLNEAYNDKLGYYVWLVESDSDITCGCLYTFDEFVRMTDEGVLHHIGNTLDYHY